MKTKLQKNGNSRGTKKNPFHRADVDGKLRLILSNGIYIDSLNLKAAIQNQIRRIAAIRNPIFYKNAAIGMSNFATSQWIYMGKDHLSGYIEFQEAPLIT